MTDIVAKRKDVRLDLMGISVGKSRKKKDVADRLTDGRQIEMVEIWLWPYKYMNMYRKYKLYKADVANIPHCVLQMHHFKIPN